MRRQSIFDSGLLGWTRAGGASDWRTVKDGYPLHPQVDIGRLTLARTQRTPIAVTRSGNRLDESPTGSSLQIFRGRVWVCYSLLIGSCFLMLSRASAVIMNINSFNVWAYYDFTGRYTQIAGDLLIDFYSR